MTFINDNVQKKITTNKNKKKQNKLRIENQENKFKPTKTPFNRDKDF